MFAAASVLAVCACFAGDPVTVTSPDGKNVIRLFDSPLAYEVAREGVTMVAKTPIGLKLDGVCLAKDATVTDVTRTTTQGTEASPVYKKESFCLAGAFATVKLSTGLSVTLAARNDGVAYRFTTPKGGLIDAEKADITIPSKDARCWFNRTNRFGCEETIPEAKAAGELKGDKNLIYLPFAYKVGGKVVAVTESDVRSYPVWNFQAVEQTATGVKLGTKMEGYPKKTEHVGGWGNVRGMKSGGRWVRITEHESFIAKAEGARTLPWRVFVLADCASKFCEADIVRALATPADPKMDFSWIKPGKVAWDWWNDWNLQGPHITFKAGCNTKSYEYYIDFAAKKGVEYVIFDEGWSEKLNIWKFHPNVDVPHLIDYANKKGVGIVLWMAWAQVYGNEEKVAAHFAKLGAKGFKVDFMDRGDAVVAEFLEKFAAACAKNKMLVDYHGAYRPVGMQRMYPNILNYEGIHGLEQMKWFRGGDMLGNDVRAFFLRLTAGPMDYTPGAMDNYAVGKYPKPQGKNWMQSSIWVNPGSLGTRCHQMAMMAVYDAPLQMLSDSPTKYEKNDESFTFMAATPVVWADTKALACCPDKLAACARRAKDGSWYAAAIGNRDAQPYTLDTSFLGTGTWKAEIFRDTPDGAEQPMKYVHETRTVTAGTKLDLPLAPGGGFVVKFTK